MDPSIAATAASQSFGTRGSATSSAGNPVVSESAEDEDQHSQASLPIGAIAGIVIGVVALVIFATGFFWYVCNLI
jgi:hypothetical protein